MKQGCLEMNVCTTVETAYSGNIAKAALNSKRQTTMITLEGATAKVKSGEDPQDLTVFHHSVPHALLDATFLI